MLGKRKKRENDNNWQQGRQTHGGDDTPLKVLKEQLDHHGVLSMWSVGTENGLKAHNHTNHIIQQ